MVMPELFRARTNFFQNSKSELRAFHLKYELENSNFRASLKDQIRASSSWRRAFRALRKFLELLLFLTDHSISLIYVKIGLTVFRCHGTYSLVLHLVNDKEWNTVIICGKMTNLHVLQIAKTVHMQL